jgi:hypothetical protein
VKVTGTQLGLLRRLELDSVRTAVRFAGGFWIASGDSALWRVWMQRPWHERGRPPVQYWGANTITALEKRGLLGPVERPAVYNTPRELTRLALLWLHNRGAEDFR